MNTNDFSESVSNSLLSMSAFKRLRLTGDGLTRASNMWLSDYYSMHHRVMAFEYQQRGVVDDFGAASSASSARWAMCGFPTFTIDSKRAAVLATTSCDASMLQVLEAPFPAFGILVDSPIIETSDGPVDPFILVSVVGRSEYESSEIHKSKQLTIVDADPGAQSFWSIFGYASKYIIGTNSCGSRRLLESCNQSDTSLLDLSSSDNRAIMAMRRLAIGLCLSLDNSGKGFGSKSRRHAAKKHSGLPGYEEYRITGPVSVDVRQALREDVKSGTGALHVQTLVRGHWKLQPCGHARSDRKHIHVMPYWRGPIDAPIAVRCPE